MIRGLRGINYDCELELNTLKEQQEIINQGLIIEPFKNKNDIKAFVTVLGIMLLVPLSGGAIMITNYNVKAFKVGNI